MHKTNSALILKLAAIAAAMSVQGIALAQPATGGAATAAEPAVSASSDAKRSGHAHKHHKRMHRHHHHSQRAFMMVPGYGPLGEKSVEALKLNDDQKKLLQEAQEAQKSARSERFEALKEKRQERADAFKAGKLDPRAALKESEDLRKASVEQRAAITDKWLALWDSLDDGQQKAVSEQFAERAEKRAERMKKHAERHAEKAERAKQS